MQFPRNPEITVSRLMNRLQKAKHLVADRHKEDDAGDEDRRFQSIHSNLQQLKILSPSIRHWEDTLTSKFSKLERHIYKILSDAKSKASNIERQEGQNKAMKGTIKKNLDEVDILIGELNELLEETSSDSRAHRSRMEEATQKMLVEWVHLRSQDEVSESSTTEILKLRRLPIRRNPERAVSNLLNLLHQAKDLIITQTKEQDTVLSSFSNIDAKLQNLITHFPKIKVREEPHVDTFVALEHHIHRICSDAKKNPSDFGGNLTLVDKKIEELTKALLETNLNSREQRSQDEDAPARKVLDEWLKLKMDESILESQAMDYLRGSYDKVEKHHVRLCLLSFSVFPENAVIKRRPLIYWWISEGFIMGTKEKTAEEVGEDVFRELIERGLVTPYPESEPHRPKPSIVVNGCKMHQWTRRMLISLAKETPLFDFDSKGMLLSGVSSSRRLFLVERDNHSFEGGNSNNTNGSNEEKAVSVFNLGEKYLDLKVEWLQKLKKAVVLQLGQWQNLRSHHIEVVHENFLKGLGTQKHLKYLSLRGISRITNLPSSLSELFNLEILDLKACHNLEKLPSDVGSLKKLTHLDVSDCPLLESMPKGIDKLTSLQVLKGFVIGNPTKTPCTISDLTKLKKLKRLGVYVGSEANVKEGEFREFKKISSLRQLTISWGVKSPTQLMTDLAFPQDLEKLDLRGIPGLSKTDQEAKKGSADPKEQRSIEPRLNRMKTRQQSMKKILDQGRLIEGLNPSKLRKLKRLYIRGGELSSLDDGDWAVEVLRLKYLKNFRMEKEKLLRQFPKLIYLEVKCDQNVKDAKYKNDFVLTEGEIKEERIKGKGKFTNEDEHERYIVSTKDKNSKDEGGKQESKSSEIEEIIE